MGNYNDACNKCNMYILVIIRKENGTQFLKKITVTYI